MPWIIRYEIDEVTDEPGDNRGFEIGFSEGRPKVAIDHGNIHRYPGQKSYIVVFFQSFKHPGRYGITADRLIQFGLNE